MGRIHINSRVRPQALDSKPGRDALMFHRRLPDYDVTSLRSAQKLADRLGLDRVWVKDESTRLGLPAFKILGASWAVYRLLAEYLPISLESWEDLEAVRKNLSDMPPITLVTATDGNHGRAVARVASWLGLPARIYMPRGTVQARIDATRSEGADVVIVAGDYDDAVRAAAAQQGPQTWLIQDTAWPSYEMIPAWIIDGYSTIFWEMEEQWKSQGLPEPEVMFVQIGVGSLAASMVKFYRNKEKIPPARLIGVEPEGAACAFESVTSGRMVSIPGPHTSVMAGLNCGTLSTLAWPLLRQGIDVFVTVEDETTFRAMRLLREDGITAGESGAAGAAGLFELFDSDAGAAVRRHLGMNEKSCVLLLVTEGITDPDMYRRAVTDRPEKRFIEGPANRPVKTETPVRCNEQNNTSVR